MNEVQKLLQTTKNAADLARLLGFIQEDEYLTDKRHIAYLLATVKHETANTFKPIYERGSRQYFDKYEPTTRIGKNLGNKVAGDGYKFRGAGYVQITGRGNATKFSKRLGLNFVAEPELLIVPEHSYKIASLGMREGLFTGKKLSDYFNDAVTAPGQARRIINGLDRAALIAGYYSKIMGVL